jgi:hypothetical protein
MPAVRLTFILSIIIKVERILRLITQNSVAILSKSIVRTASVTGSLEKCGLNGPISFSRYKQKSRELYEVLRSLLTVYSPFI